MVNNYQLKSIAFYFSPKKENSKNFMPLKTNKTNNIIKIAPKVNTIQKNGCSMFLND